MLTLSFDTCFNKSYIVLKKDSIILNYEKIESTDANYHSAYLIPKIRDILKQNSILIENIDAIGVNIGPGSFTGIRAGITIARVLAQQANVKLVGVSSLEILSKINNSNKSTIVLLDARKNKVYFAKYFNNEVIVEPSLVDKEDLIKMISSDNIVITDISTSQFLIENKIDFLRFEDNDSDLGIYLSNIVESKLALNDDYSWAKVKPLYIQKPSITKPKEIKNV